MSLGCRTCSPFGREREREGEGEEREEEEKVEIEEEEETKRLIPQQAQFEHSVKTFIDFCEPSRILLKPVFYLPAPRLLACRSHALQALVVCC